jgi:ribosomal protein L37AE/L43A
MYFYYACPKCYSRDIERIRNWIFCNKCGHKGDLQECTFVEYT